MSPNEHDGGAHSPRINAYNILVLLAIGMTSINFGYAGNVIGITLGELLPYLLFADISTIDSLI
jgi:hypothetical protein